MIKKQIGVVAIDSSAIRSGVPRKHHVSDGWTGSKDVNTASFSGHSTGDNQIHEDCRFILTIVNHNHTALTTSFNNGGAIWHTPQDNIHCR